VRFRLNILPLHLAAAAILFVVAGAALAVAPGGVAVEAVAVAAAERKPNVVLLVVDDQPEGTLDAMPIVRRQLLNRGVAIENGIIPTSSCCPSRAALLTGQYSRTTGVYKNVGAYGGWPTFDSSDSEAHTIAVSLDRAGYRTAMLGKYLNGFKLADDGYVPPGWDKFRTIFATNNRGQSTAYYDYYLVGTGPTVHYGRRPADYSTDVLGREAVRFIKRTPADVPLFLYFSPTGAHAPFTPAPRHIGTWHRERLNPAAKHLTRHRPAFWPDRLLDPRSLKTMVRRQHETLMSVDDQIGAIMDALGPERLANTLFVYLSDNGIQNGEHGLLGKYVPYSGSTDVPMALRWDGYLVPGSRDTLVTNADLTATIADAANVGLRDPDGMSLFADQPRPPVVLEAVRDRSHPSYCGIRTKRYTFVEYDDDSGAELYDHARDPNELVNLINRASYANRTASLRAATVQHCSPTPPGFTWR
jgi:arylsulfatase A-like enzyme